MADKKFDAIIVGAGIAGLVAGYILGKEGLDVLIVERGSYPGSKNMTGGRLYSHSLEKIIPNFAKEAPVQRKIVHEKFSFMTDDSAFTIDYSSTNLTIQGKDSYSIIKTEFDKWLAAKAEDAGAKIIAGICVDDLIKRKGKVCGVIAGENKFESEVVILAEGVNALLTQKLGFRDELKPGEVAIGAKELIALPEEVINDRFQVSSSEEGAAWLFVGSPTNGRIGGGFLYTNKSTISIGVVCTLEDFQKSSKTMPQLVEDFKNHPVIKPLIKGGTLLEFSSRLVPKGGYHMLPKLVDDGVLIIGDAAGFCINIGHAVRGMDLAVTSADCAAKAVIEAKKKNDYRKSSLKKYKELLEETYLMKDLKLYQNFPEFMESDRLYNEYPKIMADVLENIYVIDGRPSERIINIIMDHMKKAGIGNILKDGYKGAKSL